MSEYYFDCSFIFSYIINILLEAKSSDKNDININEIIDYTHQQLDKKLTIEVK